MKIGIVTFTASDNYGQRLQNYALQEILTKTGNDVYTIKQSEDSITLVRLLIFFLKLVIGKEKKGNKLWRKIKFYIFDMKYIKYTRTVNTFNPHRNLNKKFDRFVSGSDQVWAPVPYRFPMYMQFFASSTKKYSYAASIAAYELDDSVICEYKKYLEDFVLVSVREDRSKKLLDGILDNQKTQVDLDPTLLLDKNEWIKIEKSPKWLKNKNYVLVYNLDSSIPRELKDLANKKSLDIISLMDENSKAYTSDPGEFIYLIHHAILVYTDSYHGTIFSILFEKPFIHAVRNVKQYNMNSRFDTLFSKLGIDISQVTKIHSGVIENFSYDEIIRRIEMERKQSLNTIKIIGS